VLAWWDNEDSQSPQQQSFEYVGRLIDAYDLDGIRKYIAEGGNVNVSNRHGWTPLMFAASRGHNSLVALLIAKGADVDAVAHENGFTALANAAQGGHLEVVQMLLRAGATVKVPDPLCGGSLLLYVKSGRGQNDQRISQLVTDAGAK
jgi:ankyrin repeat protein